jgi:WD40 repeat protein
MCVSFNPSNPTLLVSGSQDRTVRLWDVGTGKELKKLEGHR